MKDTCFPQALKEEKRTNEQPFIYFTSAGDKSRVISIGLKTQYTQGFN